MTRRSKASFAILGNSIGKRPPSRRSHTPGCSGDGVHGHAELPEALEHEPFHGLRIERGAPFKDRAHLVLAIRAGVHDQVAEPDLSHPRPLDPGLQVGLVCAEAPFVTRLEEKMAQVLLDRPEDRVEAADRVDEDSDAVLQHLEYALLDRSLDRQVDDRDGMALPDPVDAADALLDAHRVPRQVVVDHRVAELEVAALAAGLGGDQDPRSRLVTEGGDGIVLLCRLELTVEHADGPAGLAELPGDVRLRVAELREDQNLDERVALAQPREAVDQRLRLGVDLDRVEQQHEPAEFRQLLDHAEPRPDREEVVELLRLQVARVLVLVQLGAPLPSRCPARAARSDGRATYRASRTSSRSSSGTSSSGIRGRCC